MHLKNYATKALFIKVSKVGESLKIPAYIACKVYCGYIVPEKDKPEVHKMLTGLSLEG